MAATNLAAQTKPVQVVRACAAPGQAALEGTSVVVALAWTPRAAPLIAVIAIIIGCSIWTPVLETIGGVINNLLFGQHPVPTLVRPRRDASLVKGQSVLLEWKWDGEEDVVFEVRARPKGSREWDRLARIREKYYTIPSTALEGSSEYEWQIFAIYQGEEYSSAIWSFKCE